MPGPASGEISLLLGARTESDVVLRDEKLAENWLRCELSG